MHYLIYVYMKGISFNYTENMTLTTYPVCTYGSHNTSITAVNRCECSSPNVTVILDQDTTLLPICECNFPTVQPKSPQENTDDRGKILLEYFLWRGRCVYMCVCVCISIQWMLFFSYSGTIIIALSVVLPLMIVVLGIFTTLLGIYFCRRHDWSGVLNFLSNRWYMQ